MKETEQQNRWIAFLGGKSLIFTCAAILMIGAAILLFSKVSFIFAPFVIILFAILPPTIFAFILYYMFYPLVRKLDQWLPRIWSVSLLFVIIIGLIILGVVLVYPSIQSQVKQLILEFPNMFKDFQQVVRDLAAHTPLENVVNQSQTSFNGFWKQIGDFAKDHLQNGAKGLGSLFSAVSTMLITLITGPIIAFFLLKDNKHFYQFSRTLFPPIFRNDFDEIAKIVDRQIGDYLKGQVVSSIILGIMYWPFFLLIGLPFAGVLAIAAGILCIIPYIGPFIVFIPAFIIAIQHSWLLAIKFLIVWFVIQGIHGHLIIPRIMGDKLKVHPVTIIFVLLVMAELLGLVGVIFGIPIYCFVKVLVIYGFRRFKRRYNKFFGEKGKYEDTEFSKNGYLD